MKAYFAYLFIGLLFLYLNLTPITRIVRDIAGKFVTPFSYIISSTYSAVSDSVTLFNNVTFIQKENVELKKKISTLEQKIVNLDEKINDQRFMQNELKLIDDSNIITADVIANESVDNFVYLTINKGSKDNITEGSTVVSNGYLVGKVESVSSNNAKVFSIAEDFIEVAVEVSRSSASGVFTCKQSQCYVHSILTSDDAVEGDLVITSGIDGNFKRGVIVGEINNIQQQKEELFKTAYIRNLLDISRVSRVGVILK